MGSVLWDRCKVLVRPGDWIAAAAAGLLLLALGLTSDPAFAQGPGLGSVPSGDLEFDCLLEPKRKVILAAPVIGVVRSVLVDRGEFVTEGQLVATIESSLEEATLKLAQMRIEMDAEINAGEARLAFETAKKNRVLELHVQGVVSDGDLDEVESSRLLAEASLLQARENRGLAKLELERARAQLEQRNIHSTVRGVVVEVIRSPGEYADPPQILELAQIDPLRVEVFVPVSALGRIEVGMQGTVLPEEPIGGSHTARVTVVDRVVDAASGTFGVRLELPNPDHALAAGLKCRVRF